MGTVIGHNNIQGSSVNSQTEKSGPAQYVLGIKRRNIIYDFGGVVEFIVINVLRSVHGAIFRRRIVLTERSTDIQPILLLPEAVHWLLKWVDSLFHSTTLYQPISRPFWLRYTHSHNFEKREEDSKIALI